MASDSNWEFECPQFVDFCSGVEKNSVDDWFGTLPSLNEESEFKVPCPVSKKKPSVFNCKLSTPVGKTPVVGCSNWVNSTDTAKIQAMQMSKRLSKSDGSLHVSVTKKPTLFCKKSASDIDIRGRKKKCPSTPRCLKRSLSKKRDKLKSSEEMELEKIAELQKQTRQRVRSNEMFMRWLKQKQDGPSVPVQKQVKPPVKEQKPPMKGFTTDRKEMMAKIDAYIHSTRVQFLKENSRVLDSSKEFSGWPIYHQSQQPWNLAGPSRVLSTSTKNKPSSTVKDLVVKQYEGHSGLLFRAAPDKGMALKLFNFHTKDNDGLVSSLKESRTKLSKAEKEVPNASFFNARNKENINISSQKLESSLGHVKPVPPKKPQVFKFDKNNKK